LSSSSVLSAVVSLVYLKTMMVTQDPGCIQQFWCWSEWGHKKKWENTQSLSDDNKVWKSWNYYVAISWIDTEEAVPFSWVIIVVYRYRVLSMVLVQERQMMITRRHMPEVPAPHVVPCSPAPPAPAHQALIKLKPQLSFEYGEWWPNLLHHDPQSSLPPLPRFPSSILRSTAASQLMLLLNFLIIIVRSILIFRITSTTHHQEKNDVASTWWWQLLIMMSNDSKD
jgi:hypothetical protein